MKTFFISTSIPYVNAKPHVGHALEFVQADVLARFHRSKGEDVFFLTGTDDNALKNVQSAEQGGIPVSNFVNQNAEIFKNLAKDLNISNDDFIRTSIEGRHIKGVQKFWLACKKTDIYKKNYKGLYCVGCEEFKTKKQLQTQECNEHPGKKLEEVEEENYFFKLSNYQKKLEELIESGEILITPDTKRNETLSFIKSGLTDFSISRSKERAKNWGVSVPNDDTQIMYVWFDALANYITALGYYEDSEKFKKFWEKADEILHVIGKGINRFHTIYWPAMLLSAGIRLPTNFFVHGYFMIDGKKMSKSIGNVVDPSDLIKKYSSASSPQAGTDAVRYYLLREIPWNSDGDFSIQKFKERYNADLANGLGNFTARVLALASEQALEVQVDEGINEKIKVVKEKINNKLQDFKFNEALEELWGLIAYGDKYLNDGKPWETGDKKVMCNTVVILDNVAALLTPFLPDTSEKITKAITWVGDVLQVKKIESLFPRAG